MKMDVSSSIPRWPPTNQHRRRPTPWQNGGNKVGTLNAKTSVRTGICFALMRAGFPASRISSPGKCHSQVSFPGVIFPGQFSDPHFFHANWVPEYRKNGFFMGVIFSACFYDTYGSDFGADFMTLIVRFCRMVSNGVEPCRRAALLRSGAALRRLRFQSLGTSQTRRTGRSKAKAACRGQQTAFYSVVMPSRETAPIVPLAKVHHLWYYSTDD